MKASNVFSALLVSALLAPLPVSCFTAIPTSPSVSIYKHSTAISSSTEPIEFEVLMPPSQSGLAAQMKIVPILPAGTSEIVEVRYKVPFGLNVEPQNGLAVCTQDGPGGEKVGDILRFTSQWTMGLPRGNGIVSTAASFSGAIGWQCSLFDVANANSWESVVEALVSNVEQRTDEVVLIFERKMNEE